MDLIKYFTYIVVLSLLAAGCGKDDGNEVIDDDDDNEVIPKITIATTAVHFEASDNPASEITFDVNVDWTVAITYEGDGQGWLSVTPAGGVAGKGQTITLTAADNLDDRQRTAYAIISYGGKAHGTTVTQAKFVDENITAHFDPVFALLLVKKGYIPDASKIMRSDVKGITSISVSGDYLHFLTSLAGIEYFISLEILYCLGNQLTTGLDVSKNTALRELYCHGNQLTGLDVSKNTALIVLICSGNQLTGLDVSKNTTLDTLDCHSNQLTGLDVSKNMALTVLACNGNQLTGLDVSKNTALRRLSCSGNQLTGLDVSRNTALRELYCYDNQLIGLLDVSRNTALVRLDCHSNQLTGLDISGNTALVTLYCYDNQLTGLDVSGNTALRRLFCEDNQLTGLDISKNTALAWWHCSGNPGIEGIFVVKVWPDYPLNNIFTTSWQYNGNTVEIKYTK